MTQTLERKKLRDQYLVAIFAVALASLLCWLLAALFDMERFFVLFIPPVIVAAVRGGLGPGLLAMGLGLSVSVGERPPVEWKQTEFWIDTLLFLTVSASLAWFGRYIYISQQALKAQTKAIEMREAYLQSLLDVMPDAMVVIDKRGIIQSNNKAAEQLFGYEGKELIGRNVSMLMPSPYREEHDGYIARYLKTGERRIIGLGRMVSARRKNGCTFPIHLTVGELKTNGRHFFIGFVRDLTERQEAESKLQELQSELLHMSRMTAMGVMTSSLAHELNQPLAAISNYLRGSQRLLDQAEPPLGKINEALEKASAQTLRASQIIRHLRDFLSRGETTRRAETLSKIIENTANLALIGTEDYRVQTHFLFRPAADQVLIDRVQVQQVLFNLMRNALEAMEGCAKRELLIATQSAGAQFVEVSLSDTGPGIPPDIAANLFKPFTSSKSQGMGLGLSICRMIVEAHGGRIWFESNPVGGTIFKFTLPRAEDKAVGNGKE